ncbi:MAG: metal-dependent hydrolase, beta-lactamase superfamily, partial [Bacteroidota bacterium]|nr:metal-dependent hydrolase, beta-lactamase superfamily [Bacteroidota bacterium]
HNLEVETIILKHRLPTTGFIFREKPGDRKMIIEKIKQYNIPHQKIAEIKKGMDFISENGTVIPNAQLTLDHAPLRSYAYCSDTAYLESFVEQIKDVTLLYHEATFVEEHAFRAEETFHSTAKQAAKVAKLAKAKKLLIGHFSARYETLDTLLNESKEIFPESHLAEEGKVFSI